MATLIYKAKKGDKLTYKVRLLRTPSPLSSCKRDKTRPRSSSILSTSSGDSTGSSKFSFWRFFSPKTCWKIVTQLSLKRRSSRSWSLTEDIIWYWKGFPGEFLQKRSSPIPSETMNESFTTRGPCGREGCEILVFGAVIRSLDRVICSGLEPITDNSVEFNPKSEVRIHNWKNLTSCLTYWSSGRMVLALEIDVNGVGRTQNVCEDLISLSSWPESEMSVSEPLNEVPDPEASVLSQKQ